MVEAERWIGNVVLWIVFLALGLSPTEEAPPPLCRFGVNAPGGIAAYDVGSLRAGWYIAYNAVANQPDPNGIEYQPVIRLKQTGPTSYTSTPAGAALDTAVAANPGAVWYVSNEPDRRIYQDDIEPGVYARAYHDLYAQIKSLDPTARIFAGSIVQPTPVRIKYLDMVLDAYQELYDASMPVDGWSIHNFILNEASCNHFPPSECWGADIPPGIDDAEGLRVDVQDNDNFTIFVQQIERFREWLKKRGYANAPVYLSEYGVLMPAGYGFDPDFTPSRVNTFMNKTFDYLLNTTDPVYGNPNDGGRLVQRFSWYSTSDPQFNGRLFEPDSGQRTLIGDNYAAYTAEIAEKADFYVSRLETDLLPSLASFAPVTVTLKATIANSGNTLTSYPVTVRFYDGNPTTGGQMIGPERTVSVAGCGDYETAEVQWPNVAAGLYKIWITVTPVDANAPEGEADQGNNTTMRLVLAPTDRSFLPTIRR